jgi:hypothetical protein
MTQEDWDELVAQGDAHGPEAVVFKFENKELFITNVQFTEDHVVVELER